MNLFIIFFDLDGINEMTMYLVATKFLELLALWAAYFILFLKRKKKTSTENNLIIVGMVKVLQYIIA